MSGTHVVTVTYGDRFENLTQTTIARALDYGADHVVVVDNGSARQSQHLLHSRFGADDRVTIVSMGQNSGSAAGFGCGIRAAVERKADFILLLDDDNWISPSTIERLHATHALVSTKFPSKTVCVSGYRDLDSVHKRLANGMPVEMAIPPPGSFMFFDAVTYVRRALHLLRTPEAVVEPYLQVPEAPYGGFYFAAEAIDDLGFPPEALRLYADDTLWTRTATEAGHVIVIDMSASIYDADSKWAGSAGSGPAGVLRAASRSKLYYSVRNRVFFERSVLDSRARIFRYWSNRIIYTGIVEVLSHMTVFKKNAAIFREAVFAGEQSDFSDKYIE